MKQFSYLVALLLAGAALTAPSALAADYTAYVACSTAGDAAPATSCLVGDKPGAFFRSVDEAVKYDVCVDFPSGERLCSGEREAAPGTLYANEILTGLPGFHSVTWYVNKALVASWRFELLAAPLPPGGTAVPQPTTKSAPASAAAQPPSAPAPSAECNREKQRVKRLLAKLSQAQGKEAKAKVRPKLKAARAAAKRLCSVT